MQEIQVEWAHAEIGSGWGYSPSSPVQVVVARV